MGGFQYLELRSTLADELLMYSDKLSMAHGLELRVPYLDKELVEYVERLPAHFKVRYGTRKWIHRRVSEGLVPRALLKRKKRGFAVNVVDAWFSEEAGGHMEAMLRDRDSLMYEHLRPSAVAQLLEEHRHGRSDHHKVLFSLTVFEQWLRQHGARGQADGRVTQSTTHVAEIALLTAGRDKPYAFGLATALSQSGVSLDVIAGDDLDVDELRNESSRECARVPARISARRQPVRKGRWCPDVLRAARSLRVDCATDGVSHSLE